MRTTLSISGKVELRQFRSRKTLQQRLQNLSSGSKAWREGEPRACLCSLNQRDRSLTKRRWVKPVAATSLIGHTQEVLAISNAVCLLFFLRQTSKGSHSFDGVWDKLGFSASIESYARSEEEEKPQRSEDDDNEEEAFESATRVPVEALAVEATPIPTADQVWEQVRVHLEGEDMGKNEEGIG